jgi:hypothetical protein
MTKTLKLPAKLAAGAAMLMTLSACATVTRGSNDA